jgi:D-alanyl-D-alanine-carboxypeptidase/D-alanyl-D-alanine-endopeptidase
MKRALMLVGCLMAFACRATSPTLLPDRINQAARDATSSSGMYPTLIIAVVDGDRSGVFAFGRLDNGKAPDAATLYEIGSVTKTFTATLLADEVIKGGVSLDEPVARLLPGYAIPSRNGKQITLQTLAMHDSGLPRLPTDFRSANPADPFTDYTAARLEDFLKSYVLPRDPGDQYEYSNLGVAVLGNALAMHAKVDYATLLRARILSPLGMSDSATTMVAGTQSRYAPGHGLAGNPVPNWNLGVFAPAGGLRSSGAEMLSYLKANMGLTPTPLYPAMQLAQKARGPGPKSGDQIGLVWLTQVRPDGNIIWHGGNTGGYSSFIGFTADRKHGVVILTNVAADVDALAFATLRPSWPMPAVHKKVVLTSAQLDDCVGEYQLTPKLVINVTHVEDHLVGQATGQGAVPMFATAPDEFFATVGDISVSFTRVAGKVTGMVLHQHGDHTAPRIR